MDDVLNELTSSLSVSSEPNDTSAPHPRFSQYKQKSNIISQEVRREKFLLSLKDRRFDYLQYVRSLAEGTVIVDENEDTKDEDENMDCSTKPRKPPRTYKNQLMLSEWLVEVPHDFEKEWLMVFCPIGKRSLVVSCRGKTCAYTKSGFLVNTFPSLLPGGNRKLSCGSSEYTLIDCIYSEVDRTFYVLDMMCWRCQPIFDSATDFRFFWLNSKLSEIPEVYNHSKLNPYRFIPLLSFSCDVEALRTALWSQLPFQVKLDGLLFYSKETHYTHGRTPLVGWLKAHMVPTLLGVNIPPYLCHEDIETNGNSPQKSTGSQKKQKRRNTEKMDISISTKCADEDGER